MAKGIKTGGRKKGTLNKITQETRETFNILLSNNIDKMQEWIDDVGSKNPAKALDILLKLSEYVVPKLNRVEVVEEKEKPDVNVPISMWVDDPEEASRISGIPMIKFVE